MSTKKVKVKLDETDNSPLAKAEAYAAQMVELYGPESFRAKDAAEYVKQLKAL